MTRSLLISTLNLIVTNLAFKKIPIKSVSNNNYSRDIALKQSYLQIELLVLIKMFASIKKFYSLQLLTYMDALR